MYDSELSTESLGRLFKVLSKPDALKIFLFANRGIESSTYAIEELDLTPKRYYARLRELVDIGFVRKTEGAYRQTPLGSIIYSRLLPAMEEAYDNKDKLDLLVQLDETGIESGIKKLIVAELEIPIFVDSNNWKIIEDYESMVVDVIDLCDNAEKSFLIASNYMDVRVLDSTLRSMDRGVDNRFIMGKNIFSSKLQQIRMMLSPKFTRAIMNLASSCIDMNKIARIIDLHYSFCIVDGNLNIIEVSNSLDVSFIVALRVKSRGIGEKLTDLFEALWDAGDSHSMLEFISAFKS